MSSEIILPAAVIEPPVVVADPPLASVVVPDDVSVVNAPVDAVVAPIAVPSTVPPSTFIEVKAESPLIKLFIEVVFTAIAVSASDSLPSTSA